MKPQEVAKFLIYQRKSPRRCTQRHFWNSRSEAIDAVWVKSCGRFVPLLGNEIFLRLHDRYSIMPGKIELVQQDEISQLSDFLALAEKYPGEKTCTLLPLTRLIPELKWLGRVKRQKRGPDPDCAVPVKCKSTCIMARRTTSIARNVERCGPLSGRGWPNSCTKSRRPETPILEPAKAHQKTDPSDREEYRGLWLQCPHSGRSQSERDRRPRPDTGVPASRHNRGADDLP